MAKENMPKGFQYLDDMIAIAKKKLSFYDYHSPSGNLENADTSNKFDYYSSKIRRINIPIPSFSFFHKASSEEQVDPKFIGREQISEKLYSWLLNEEANGGSYLITGFRGMGKSSFVGRVLNELTRKVGFKEYIGGLIFFMSLFVWGGLLFSFFLVGELEDIVNNFLFWAYFFIIVSGSFYYVIFRVFCKSHNEYQKITDDFKKMMGKEFTAIKQELGIYSDKTFKEFYKDYQEKINWNRVCHVLNRENVKNRTYKRICISVNLGQEILNERDVLSLLSHQLYTKYRKFVLSPIANFKNWSINILLIYSLSSIIMGILFYKTESTYHIIITVYCLLILAVSIIYHIIALQFSSSQSKIMRKLRILNERLDSQISYYETYATAVGYSTAKTGANYTKRRSYDVAKIREIEQELIDILNSISKTSFGEKLSVVFVFDELDKVDSNSLRGASLNNQIEFTNEKNFPGGGATRRRKQNVLHLLANMKLFVSTAKAKFIFISGRELYDAYLADLSDREFAVSSIFNGVIYVDSFCVNENKAEDVMSNVEMYICKQLIPQEYIKRQFARQYIVELLKGSAFERFDINLKMYYQYLIEEYEKVIPEFDSPADNICWEQSPNNRVANKNLYRNYIDKTINLLYHFSVYLYHISNGSPKKIMLHFEKYVRTTCNIKEFTLSKESVNNKFVDPNEPINIRISMPSKHHLSFGYMDQRTIGFIHYISFPINQILVNANQYSDKLLVSVSFLIDHIYKYHNGGFSWRNLEYTPELLEVYKIPGFRSFINSIISYLKQTHIVPITCGLYQYKFRRRIADEIALASRSSEEIAALFNFTLDESLNIKQHYADIREAYLQLEAKGDKHTPRLIIGLHNILGDLYMFDEEFNNAILEYHAAINTQEMEMKKNDKESPSLEDMLYLIRLLLKLGLANEKRNTNETAFVIYSKLVALLFEFRHFDEQKLHLTYRLQKNSEWPSYEGILFPEKYSRLRDLETSKFFPSIISESDDLFNSNIEFMAKGEQLSNMFSHLLTPPKYSIIQRISLFQDIRLVFQALLAKLFVKEKMELGGITISDLDMIESEYLYLNLASNVKEKFLASSDFFRRLGDIMFYKNGLTATKSPDSFVEGLLYWGIDIKREVLDFCNINHCYQYYERIYHVFLEIKNETVSQAKSVNINKVLMNAIKNNSFLGELNNNGFHLGGKEYAYKLRRISCEKVLECNSHRQKMFCENTPVPCHSCKYYNKSLRHLMQGMFKCDILEEQWIDIKDKTPIINSNIVFIVLKKIIEKGTSCSLRQDYVIQLAEILDCKANVLLSCATDEEDRITEGFMKAFLSDIGHIDFALGVLPNINTKDFTLFTHYTGESRSRIYKLEEAVLYYWEASICFRIGNDLIKASASLKKILRIFQNYVKISKCDDRRKIIFQNIDNLKTNIVKPCLFYLYSHYNNINFAEIQKLKWIFSTQMYESISFNRLSLFPDVEHIMIVYFDLIRRCSMGRNSNTNESNSANLIRLSCIYNNTAFSSLRQDSTVYERVMALRFKTLMNRDFLLLLLDRLNNTTELKSTSDIFYEEKHKEKFVEFFVKFVCDNEPLPSVLGGLKHCFMYHVDDKKEYNPSDKLQFIEFLIKDSLYCITRILEIITPHSTVTLFTNSFYGEIYQLLYEWNLLFDGIYMIYKCIDEINGNNDKQNVNNIKIACNLDKINCEESCPFYTRICPKKKNTFDKIKSLLNESQTDEMAFFKKLMSAYRKQQKGSLSTRFFNETLRLIGKAQVNLTLAKFSLAMAIESYKNALETHHEGKAYKDMIIQMYYLDDDLRNDTIHFGAAVERYKINNGYIRYRINQLESIVKNVPMYNIEHFGHEFVSTANIGKRFKNM